jgi:aminopeptidase N
MLFAAGLFAVSTAGTAQESAELRLKLAPVNYDLDLTVDYEAEQLRGDVGLTFRNWSEDPVTEVPLLLYRLMTVESATGTDGRELSVVQTVVSYDDFAKLQVNAVTVTLPVPLAPGDTTEIHLRYSGHLLGYSETGMRYVKDRIDPAFTIIRPDARTYPTIRYPSWAANRRTPLPDFTYRARITAPDTLVVANGGELLGTETADGSTTWTYRGWVPSWRMDFAIASYRTLEAGPVRIFYLPGDSVGAAGVQREAAGSLALFEEWFGPLRGTPALTVLEIPEGWGSQADVRTIIQTAAAFRDSTRHHEVYHEVSHLWNPPDGDTPSPRWNEGLASYLQYATIEALHGRPALEARANRLIERLRGWLTDEPVLRATPLIRYGEAQIAGRSYTVGALFFTLVDRVVGPGALHTAVREFYRRHHDNTGTTEQFMTLLRDAAGPAVEPIIRDWIYTTGWVARVESSEGVEGLVAAYR